MLLAVSDWLLPLSRLVREEMDIPPPLAWVLPPLSWLAALLSSSCHYFGNALGPEYNAAHANHYHFGMRGQGFCF